MASSTTTLLPASVYPWVNGLTNGTYWSLGVNRTVTWSMADYAGVGWNASVAGPVIDSVLSKFSEVANINFSYAGYSTSPFVSSANMVFVETTKAAYLGMSEALAWAYFPNEPLADNLVKLYGFTAIQYPNSAGDVWLNMARPEIYASSESPGSTFYFTLLHEVGHALGLKHPHDDGATGRPTFSNLGISLLDNQLITIMSYDEATTLASWYAGFGLPSSTGYPSSLMPMDVVALQSIYGPNVNTRTGNNIYRLYNDSSVDTMWDAGGIDTISASDSYFGWYVNMDAGFGGYRLSFATPIDFLGRTETGNFVFNAENIQGSNYHDILVGDGIGNVIDGGGGDDWIIGGAGNDLISGGAGNDIIDGGAGEDVIAGGDGADIISLNGNDSASGGRGYDFFCITGKGNYIITDFSPAEDRIVFDSYGTKYSNISQLISGVKSISNANGDMSVTLSDGENIKLVGCANSNIFVDFFYDVSGAIHNLIGV